MKNQSIKKNQITQNKSITVHVVANRTIALRFASKMFSNNPLQLKMHVDIY
jgi:hypothetical protein